jgi:predicted phosphate transport protein (TIGR00153 family)
VDALSERLLRWFESRRETAVIQLLRQHAVATTDVGDDLVKAIELAIAGKYPELKTAFERQKQKEIEADALRRKVMQELAKGELPLADRGDMMRLARRIDLVTDWSHEAVRILVLFKISEMPKDMQEAALRMCKTVRECIWALRKCLEKLADRDIDESFRLADQVERIEEQVDDQYQQARILLLNLDNSIKVGAAILLSEFLDSVENTADRCEDTCDQVRVIAIRTREKVQ